MRNSIAKRLFSMRYEQSANWVYRMEQIYDPDMPTHPRISDAIVEWYEEEPDTLRFLSVEKGEKDMGVVEPSDHFRLKDD